MTLWRSAKRVLVGRPLETLHLESERLSKATGLAVLSSDALSSVAYAAEAMLLVLVTAGAAGVGHALVVAGFILLLLAIVASGAYALSRVYHYNEPKVSRADH